LARGGYDVSITITTQWREGGKPPSPQKIERIKKPIRDLNTEIRKQQGLLSRFYNILQFLLLDMLQSYYS